MSQPTNPIATLSHIIQFHGLYLIVRKYNNVDYIALKPIVEAIGIDWRNIKRNMETYDSQKLYGYMMLLSPLTDTFGGHMTPKTPVETLSNELLEQKSEQKVQYSEDFCIRLDRVIMFLARVNTSKIRSAGNEQVADYLLSLQQEWADALHQYESYGVAVKRANKDWLDYTSKLVDVYHKVDDRNHKAELSRRIDNALEFSRPLVDNQPDMFN